MRNNYEDCLRCDGRGVLQPNNRECARCNGTGEEPLFVLANKAHEAVKRQLGPDYWTHRVLERLRRLEGNVACAVYEDREPDREPQTVEELLQQEVDEDLDRFVSGMTGNTIDELRKLARDVLTKTLHGPVPQKTVMKLAQGVLALADKRVNPLMEVTRHG